VPKWKEGERGITTTTTTTTNAAAAVAAAALVHFYYHHHHHHSPCAEAVANMVPSMEMANAASLLSCATA